MRLSSNSRFVHAYNSGHNIHAFEAELIAAEVLKLYDEVENKS